MLARPNRLRQASDITRAYKKGVYGGVGGVLSAKAVASGRPVTRVVVVVSKKIDKRAVVRNRIRRRLLGLLEESWATVRTGYDIVISVHSDVSGLPADTLRQHLNRTLSKAGVITT